ncbi:MAG: hypothetical protein ACXWPM_03150 [Bdellovibrionota bacterium]
MRNAWIPSAAGGILIGLALGTWLAGKPPVQLPGIQATGSPSPRGLPPATAIFPPFPSPFPSPSPRHSASPSPSPSAEGSVSDAELQTRLSDLKIAIQQQESRLAAIDAQIRSAPEWHSSDQQSQQFLATQQNALRQQQLASLDRQILEQQRILGTLQMRAKPTLAPDLYDESIQRQIAETQARINDLKQSYASIMNSEAQSLQQNYAGQTQNAQERQAAQADLAAARTQAQAELQRLTAEYNQLQKQGHAPPNG